jgi:hypothetical protein
MGRSKKPESFPRELLQQPIGARIHYFEVECIIKHTKLEEICREVLRLICMPEEDMRYRGRGTMVLVIGPPRVGKSTFIELLIKELLKRAETMMLQDPSCIPFVSVTTDIDVGHNGSFDWSDFHPEVLKQLRDPFMNLSKRHLMRARDLKEAMVEGILQRKTRTIIIDEAHHLAQARLGRRLQDNLYHLKYFENKTGVSHVLVGTYAMQRFRKVNAQLALRSDDVHFSRYDIEKEEDRIAFKSALWALQRQLPVLREPQLLQHWEFLYERSLGCIGLLKQHLNKALRCAYDDIKVKTITIDHLQKTALSKDKVLLGMKDILNGERDLTELDEANGNLLEELGQLKHESSEDIVSHKQEDNSEESSAGLSSKGQARVSSSSKQGQQLKPFERSPDRDPIGPRNKNESEEKDHENAEDSIETEDESEEWEQGVEDEDTNEIAS